MPTWDSGQYLRFADERTRPCRDLVNRIPLAKVGAAIDLGCGPGNSTAVIKERWPDAVIAGLDNSEDMIASARASYPANEWRVCDIAAWPSTADRQYDLVFSNAALQWVPDHARLYPELLRRVAPGGVLAAQMPGNYDGTAHRLMRELAASAAWRGYFPEGSVREWHVHDVPFYYDVLAPHAARVDLWETEYIHVMPDAEAIVEWYKGTGLRPFLDALECAQDRERFKADYLDLIRTAYPARSDGRVLFPFRRLFIVAQSHPL